MQQSALAPPNDGATNDRDPLALASVALVLTCGALALIANDWIIEHRIVALLRREPRLWHGAIAIRLGFRSSYGTAAIARALRRLDRRRVISKETGSIFDTVADTWRDVDLWTIRHQTNIGGG